MAGIPLERFERAYADTEYATAIDSPVMYDVWREYAIRGPHPHAPPRLLLQLAEAAAAPDVVRRLTRVAESVQGDPRPAIGVAGDWLVLPSDLAFLVRVVLPHTRWAGMLAVVNSLTAPALVDLLVPFDELLDRGANDAPPGEESSASPQAPTAGGIAGTAIARPAFDPRDQQVASWLLRMLARMMGYDADLDSERVLAATEFKQVLFPGTSLETAPSIGQSLIESVNLDRVATVATVAPPPDLNGLGPLATVKADAARRLFEISTASQTWAIIDSGVNASHPAFRTSSGSESRVVETFDLTRITDDQLTLPAALGPIDHLVDVVQSCAVPSWRADSPGHYREPVNSHGTHVAGILAGRVMGKFEGLCPEMRLWDFRVLGDNSDGNESRIIMALRFIRHINDRSRALTIVGANMSISIGYNPKNAACGWTPVCEEVRRLVRSGVVVVAAAGNAGYQAQVRSATGAAVGQIDRSKGTGFEMISVTDPGNTDEAITVGSTHGMHPHRYGTSYFSSRGPTADGRIKPDVLAPGQQIKGPVGAEGYVLRDGTSQAAPHVSGAAAILMARYPELVGQPERIKSILCSTATDLGRERYFQGHGLVDVLRALQSM